MAMRIDYPTLAKEKLRHLHRLRAALADEPGLPGALRSLIELRVSQINRCAYCCDLHSVEAREAGVPQQQLDVLAAWHEAPAVFDERTRAALRWAEQVTVLGQHGPDDDAFSEVWSHYTDEQVADITLLTVLMNAYNRLAVAFENQPTERRA